MIIQGNYVGGLIPSAEQVGARPDTWMPTAAQVGARPNTWMPTAAQVGAPTMDYAKKVGAPHNLLDNSDFSNPINQRSLSEYSNVTYTVDRWKWTYAASTRKCKLYSKSISLSNESASMAYYAQTFEKTLANGVYTIAAKIGGTIYSKSISTFGSTEKITLPDGASIYINSDGAAINFAIPSGVTISGISWVALYNGEFTSDTLPEYQPKGYAVELAECQRYFYRINAFWKVHGSGMCITAGKASITITLPQAMRVSPTVTIADDSKVQIVCGSGTTYALSGVEWNRANANNDAVEIGANVGSEAVGISAMLYLGNGGTIDFSADL